MTGQLVDIEANSTSLGLDRNPETVLIKLPINDAAARADLLLNL
jgi:hypothetical protein